MHASDKGVASAVAIRRRRDTAFGRTLATGTILVVGAAVAEACSVPIDFSIARSGSDSGGTADSNASDDASWDAMRTLDGGTDATDATDSGAADAPLDARPPPPNPCAAHGGKTYYVATTGSNANSGSIGSPFLTVVHGVNVLTPGDTLCIRGGTYEETVHDMPSGTSWSAPVTVAAYPGETVTIKNYTGSGWPVLYLYGRSYIVIDGLIIDGADQAGTNYFAAIDIGDLSHHIRFQNSELKNGHSGIYIFTTAHDNEFLNISVHDNGFAGHGGHGFYMNGYNNLIDGCDVYRNAGWGVHIYWDHAANTANDNIVRNNKLHDNARDGTRGSGLIFSSGNRNKAYNNIIWGNVDGILVGYWGATDNEVYDNTIYNNSKSGIYVGVADPAYPGAATNTIVKNNILYQNGTAYGAQYVDNGVGTTQSANLIGTDPKFVDVLAHDFHLQAGSPAINAGVFVGAVTTDFDGNARPQGAAYDIGAFEFIY